MIDIGTLFDLGAELFQNIFEGHEQKTEIKREKKAHDQRLSTDKSNYDVLQMEQSVSIDTPTLSKAPEGKYKTPLDKKAYIAGGLGYVALGLYSLGIEAAKMMYSGSPQALATLAIASPPILGTAVFAVGVAFNIASIAKIALSQTHHEKGTPEHTAWKTNRNMKLATTTIALATCTIFLASSIVPVPGAMNIVGLVLLGGLIAAEGAKHAIKSYMERKISQSQISKSQEGIEILSPKSKSELTTRQSITENNAITSRITLTGEAKNEQSFFERRIAPTLPTGFPDSKLTFHEAPKHMPHPLSLSNHATHNLSPSRMDPKYSTPKKP